MFGWLLAFAFFVLVAWGRLGASYNWSSFVAALVLGGLLLWAASNSPKLRRSQEFLEHQERQRWELERQHQEDLRRQLEDRYR